MTRHVGRITEWQDERGFGFVTPDGGGDRAFVHIKEFERGSPRPMIGMVISFELQIDQRRRLYAARPRVVDSGTRSYVARSGGLPRKGMAAVFLIAISFGCLTSQFPASLALVYAGMSAIAFVMYGIDKSAAVYRLRRIPEANLQVVGLLGGWPGSLFAQEAFRHKTSKSEFQILFWFTVVMNCSVLVWLLSTNQMETVDHAVAKAIAEGAAPVEKPITIRITPLQ